MEVDLNSVCQLNCFRETKTLSEINLQHSLKSLKLCFNLNCNAPLIPPPPTIFLHSNLFVPRHCSTETSPPHVKFEEDVELQLGLHLSLFSTHSSTPDVSLKPRVSEVSDLQAQQHNGVPYLPLSRAPFPSVTVDQSISAYSGTPALKRRR